MAQATIRNTTTASRFHNISNEALAGAIVGQTPARRTMGAYGPDPIFSAIAAHMLATQAFAAARETWWRCDMLADNYDDITETATAASDKESESLLKVLTTTPVTLRGIIALLEHMASPEYLDVTDDSALASNGDVVWARSSRYVANVRSANQFLPLRLAGVLRAFGA